MTSEIIDRLRPNSGATFGPAPERGAAITIRGLGKSFGENSVLRGVDLHIPAGQFVAVIGRSGCGKSTLLRLLAGLDQPSEGRIAFGAEDEASRGKPVARVMFQEPRLLPWQSILANVVVGQGSGNDRRAHRAREALAAVGLEHRSGEWPAVLSGGQKQRVALARALVSRPQFLALDEPLGALDALTRIEMQKLLERVWQDERFTAVLVTHDVAEAIALADRIVLIEDGAIALDLQIRQPRPRRRGSVDLALLEEQILRRLLREDASAPEYAI